LTRDAPPVEFLIPPTFEKELINQEFYNGGSMYYALPETFSESGYKIET